MTNQYLDLVNNSFNPKKTLKRNLLSNEALLSLSSSKVSHKDSNQNIKATSTISEINPASDYTVNTTMSMGLSLS